MSNKFIFHPIEDLEAAKAFILRLIARGMEFHLEDDPADIVNHREGGYLFNSEEAVAMRMRQGELYALDWTPTGHECPIGYMMAESERCDNVG